MSPRGEIASSVLQVEEFKGWRPGTLSQAAVGDEQNRRRRRGEAASGMLGMRLCRMAA